MSIFTASCGSMTKDTTVGMRLLAWLANSLPVAVMRSLPVAAFTTCPAASSASYWYSYSLAVVGSGSRSSAAKLRPKMPVSRRVKATLVQVPVLPNGR
jgi:hypothetical protein